MQEMRESEKHNKIQQTPNKGSLAYSLRILKMPYPMSLMPVFFPFLLIIPPIGSRRSTNHLAATRLFWSRRRHVSSCFVPGGSHPAPPFIPRTWPRSSDFLLSTPFIAAAAAACPFV